MHRSEVHKGKRNKGLINFSKGRNCKYCDKYINKLHRLHFHENHCKLNPNALPILGHKYSEESKLKMKLTNSINHRMSGYREGAGYGKKGKYKGIWCDSSWGLAFVIYNLEHNIEFKRNTDRFDYEYNGKLHKYVPDFIINNEYYEIKGWKSKQWESKFNQFPKNLKLNVIDSSTINRYLDYVISKYGYEYTKLYE